MFRQIFLALCLLFALAHGDVVAAPRSFTRLHFPALGLGPRCDGCPPHYCNDDFAIIHGYCCGCARFYDNLPVVCSPYLSCPLNGHDLCQQYEYMMYCCCGNP